MSKGTKIINVRMPLELIEEICGSINSINATTREEEWDFSRWIRSACLERLAKLERGRKAKATSRKIINNGKLALETKQQP